MSEWTVNLKTSSGSAVSDETLETIHEALDGDPAASVPVVGFHVPLPIITARIQVAAESTDEARDVALSAFGRALAAAGVAADCEVSDVDPA